MSLIFEITSKAGKRIRLTKVQWQKIIAKHTIVNGLEKVVMRVLQKPSAIRRSIKDKSVFLYYKKYQKHFFCVVTRHLNDEGFIITAYLTDKIKIGEVLWEEW